MTHEITDADIQFNLMQAELITQLAAANARIAELEAQLDNKVDALMHNMVLREQIAALKAQLAAHPVTDDYGVTQVTP